MSVFKQNLFIVRPKFLHGKYTISKRTLAKLIHKQDPDENLPLYQFATDKTKRSSRIYMWGNAVFGALGNPSFLIPRMSKLPLRTMHKPWRHPFADRHKVCDVSCGYGFTVIAGSNSDTDYSLFGTGINGDFQIGYHTTKKGNPLEILVQPVPILLPLINSSTKAIQVSCGRAHTVVITDKEGVFSLGNNAYGQCGSAFIPKVVNEKNFKINKLDCFDEEISKVFCGQDHTLFLSKSGTVYSCGWGADGQTGLGHYKNQAIPNKVKGDIEGEKIVQISCAADCVLAVSDKGDVFGWGNSEYCQLNSITDEQQINISRHLKFNNIGKVSQVASGGTMCAVLSEEGSVYVWGYGILGQGPMVTSLPNPTLLPPPLFGLNEFSTDVKVEQIACSLSHFAAVTNKGHLYMWGRNRSNCLGLGREGDQFFPYKISVPAVVEKICCGVDHTAVICKSFA